MAKQVYFVTALTNPEKVAEKLNEAIQDPAMFIKLADDKWFVSFDGITHDLAEKLGIRSDPHVGTGLVLPVSSYSGRAPTTVWDWLKLRMT